MKSKSFWPLVNTVLIFIIGIVLSLKSFAEPDLWWMLRTGKWIVSHHEVPVKDVFSFTCNGVQWINVKWLFEVMVYYLSLLGGDDFIILLQALVTSLIIYILIKTYSLLCKTDARLFKWQQPYISPGFFIAALAALFISEFRLTGRPEMMSHLFTIVFIFLIINFIIKSGRLVYLIIPLQALWTNLHEAYGTGVVICWITVVVFLIVKVFIDRTDKHVFKFLPVAIAATLSTAVHPYGIKMIWHPFEIFSQLNQNKFTTELINATDAGFWTWNALASVLFFLCLGFFTVKLLRAESALFKTLAVFYGITGVAFFFLAMTAYRNIPFIVFIAVPAVAFGMDQLIHQICTVRNAVNVKGKSAKKFTAVLSSSRMKSVVILTSVIGLFAWYSITSGRYYDLTKSKSKYGLQLDVGANPYGAAQFVLDNNISGRCFSDYLTSSYLMWRLQPDFKTFIDLRDLDVFPVSFFGAFQRIVTDASEFNKADSIYKFDYVILFRAQFASLHQYLSRTPGYSLVFVDEVAAVYLKNEERFKPLISKYGFNDCSKDLFTEQRTNQSSVPSSFVSGLFNPFYKPHHYENALIETAASEFYSDINCDSLALLRITNAMNENNNSDIVLTQSGLVNLKMVGRTVDMQQRIAYVEKAETDFNKALEINSENPTALTGTAQCRMMKGEREKVLPLLQQAVRINKSDALALGLLSDVYEDLAASNSNMAGDYYEKRAEVLIALDKLTPNNPNVQLQVALCFSRLKRCSDAKIWLQRFKGFRNFNSIQMKELNEVEQNCH